MVENVDKGYIDELPSASTDGIKVCSVNSFAEHSDCVIDNGPTQEGDNDFIREECTHL